MPTHPHTVRILSVFAPLALFTANLVFAQGHAAPPQRSAAAARTAAAPPAAPVAAAPTERDVAATQTQLIKLLRLSPKLTSVVARDPSLLSNQDYIAQNNPELAAFLAAHPEIARNPDFYLFTHMNQDGGGPDEALERAVWPEVYRTQPRQSAFALFLDRSPPLLAFFGFLVAFFLTLRMFIENRRWSRIFTLQSEVHSKLIDRFSSTQELAAYMETEPGKRFLEAAPIPVNLAAEQRMPNAVARVLTPLQIGVVLVLLGAGLLALRHSGPDMDIPMRVLGTIILMPGAGFIISAGITWFLAARLGLMPPPAPSTRNDAPFRPSDHN